MFRELQQKTRTVRHFVRSKPLTDKEIEYIVDCARITPSAANLQRVRYAAFSDLGTPSIFSHVAFAGYLPDEEKTKENDAPVAYLVLMTEAVSPDTNLAIDIGICAEAAVLAARDIGIGACMIRSFDKAYFIELVKDLGYVPQLVIALGYPALDGRIVEVENGSVKYYKDENGTTCVPKLSLDSVYLKHL